MADKCINSNSDIAGIGIRINFYATILLTAITPENDHTDELLDGLYKNSVINGLSLVITAVIQTMQKQLDLYHAIFVMQIIFSLNFVYAYGQRRFILSGENDFRMKIFIGFQTLTTVVFTVWLLYVWIKGSNFGSQPTCNHLVKYVLFFADVRATVTWLRVLFIMNLVMTACTLLFRFGAIISEHMEQLREEIHKVTHKLKKRTKEWRIIARTEPQVPREPQGSREEREREELEEQGSNHDGPVHRFVTLSLVYAVYGVATLELIAHRNRSNIQPGEDTWGFGQIIAVILLLGSLIDIVVLLRDRYAKKETHSEENPKSEPDP